MGLDCSHDAFHGAYSAFNSFRQAVCRAVGGSYPPHWRVDSEGFPLRINGQVMYDTDLDPNQWYVPDEITQKQYPGLWEFFLHSDCDGEISPEMCALVARDLEPLLDKMPAESAGHIAGRGGYRQVLQYFIDGCKAAHSAGEPLDFH